MPTPRKTAPKPAAKAAPKKVAPKFNPDEYEIVIKSLLDKVVRVPLSQLTPHPRNPRQGNVQAVADSLKVNGQYKPIVVQKSTQTILAGNHTWLGARRNGWTHIDAVFLDVDDESGLRIMLADNKTSDDSTYDESVLAEILASLATTDTGLDGTAFDPGELQDLVDSVSRMNQSAPDLDGMLSAMPKTDFHTQSKREQYEAENDNDEVREAKKARGVTKAAEGADDEADSIDEIRDGEVELQAVLEVKVTNVDFWKRIGREGGDSFEIPPLREDMLLDELPSPLGTWAGNDVTPDDGVKWFLYNYSLGGTKGLPFDRTILAFNTHDDKFEGWWETPAWYASRVIYKGCRIAVLPDFSFYYTQPRVVHLMNVHRAQWMGRFFQEAGMKVIPRLQFDYNDPNTLDIALRGIPRNVPVLATSQQNIEEEKLNGPKITKILQEALDEIQPKQFLYYCGPGGKRAMAGVRTDAEVVYLENYVGLRRELAFGKKEGLAGTKKVDRQKLLKNARKRVLATSQAAEGQAEDDDDV